MHGEIEQDGKRCIRAGYRAFKFSRLPTIQQIMMTRLSACPVMWQRIGAMLVVTTGKLTQGPVAELDGSADGLRLAKPQSGSGDSPVRQSPASGNQDPATVCGGREGMHSKSLTALR